jgi:hypothetical protein
MKEQLLLQKVHALARIMGIPSGSMLVPQCVAFHHS